MKGNPAIMIYIKLDIKINNTLNVILADRDNNFQAL